MRDTQGSKRLTLPRGRASGWSWSSCRTQNEASFCCPGDGLSSVASRGRLVSGDWLATMNVCQKRWQGCTSLLSLFCWLLVSFNLLSSSIHLFVDVHNTL